MSKQNGKYNKNENRVPQNKRRRRRKQTLTNLANNTNQQKTIGQICSLRYQTEDERKFKENYHRYRLSPVTIMPNDPSLYKSEDIELLEERNQEVNEKKFFAFKNNSWTKTSFNQKQCTQNLKSCLKRTTLSKHILR